MFWANTQLFSKTWVLIPNWFDRVPNYFQIQGWKLKFQGQKNTWLPCYIMITVHNRCFYSPYDKYYQYIFILVGIFIQIQKWKYDFIQWIKFWWGEIPEWPRNCLLLWKVFKNGQHGGHIGYQYGMISEILNLHVAQMPPTKFGLNLTKGSGADVVSRISRWRPYQDGHHGGHLGYRNGTILAILNLYVAPMSPIKFQLNLTYSLRGDVVWRISRWPPQLPSWISEQNNFSNSESLCCSNTSDQISAQSDLWLGRRCWLSWISEPNDFSNSDLPCCHNASH